MAALLDSTIFSLLLSEYGRNSCLADTIDSCMVPNCPTFNPNTHREFLEMIIEWKSCAMTRVM